VIKEILSTDSLFKSVISQREDGVLDVVTLKWTHEYVPGHGEVCESFWERVAGPSLTDTLESAENIAKEELRSWSGQPIDKD